MDDPKYKLASMYFNLAVALTNLESARQCIVHAAKEVSGAPALGLLAAQVRVIGRKVAVIQDEIKSMQEDAE